MATLSTRRQFLTATAGIGALALWPFPTVAGPAAAPPPARRTLQVSNSSMLASALSGALPGDHIVIANGSYYGSFTLSRSGTADAPIVVRAASPLGARISGSFNLQGNYVQLWSLTIVDGSALLYGNENKVMRCRFERGPSQSEAVTCFLMSGTDAEISANEFRDIKQKGVAMRLQYGVRRPRITYNYFRNFQGTVGTNVREPIQLGYGARDSYISLNAVVMNNVIEQCSVDDEAISVKSSDNLVAFNTIINCYRSAIHVRRGTRNRVIGNWIENAGGIRVMDLGNLVVSNVLSGGEFNWFEIFAGNAEAGVSSPDVYYPRAKDTKLSGNVGRVIVGRVYGSASPRMNMPALNTIIEAHQGQISYVTHQNTRVTATSSVQLARATKLSSSQVGVYA